MEEWRLVYIPDGDIVDTVALPGTIITGVSQKLAPNTILILGFRKTGISLGYFQDLDTEVDVEACKQYDVQVVRRLGVGGGTIFIDRIGSMGMLMAFDKNIFPSMDKAFCQIGCALSHGYSNLGVKGSWYDHIGDVRVGYPREAKKITGFGFTTIGNVMVQNTILGPGNIDVETMIKTTRIPPEKFADKDIKRPEDWVYNVEAETGKRPSNEEVVAALKAAFEDTLRIKLVEGEFVEQEKKVREQYRTMATSDAHHYFRSSGKRFAEIPEGCKLGLAKYKARKLIVSHVLVDEQKKIRDVQLSGDFYCGPTEYLTDMEKSLAGVNARDKGALLSKVKETYVKPNWEIPMVDAEEFVTAIGEAAEKI